MIPLEVGHLVKYIAYAKLSRLLIILFAQKFRWRILPNTKLYMQFQNGAEDSVTLIPKLGLIFYAFLS